MKSSTGKNQQSNDEKLCLELQSATEQRAYFYTSMSRLLYRYGRWLLTRTLAPAVSRLYTVSYIQGNHPARAMGYALFYRGTISPFFFFFEIFFFRVFQFVKKKNTEKTFFCSSAIVLAQNETHEFISVTVLFGLFLYIHICYVFILDATCLAERSKFFSKISKFQNIFENIFFR